MSQASNPAKPEVKHFLSPIPRSLWPLGREMLLDAD